MGRPTRNKHMVSFLLFSQGTILVVLAVAMAFAAHWVAALGLLGSGLSMWLAAALTRRSGN